jgi:hypothetical protein
VGGWVNARRIIFLMAVLSMSGCVPFVHFVDYRPEMQDGKVTRDNCLGYERVTYQVDGVKFTHRINLDSRGKADALSYRAFLTIPEGEHATFLSTNVQVEKLRDSAIAGKPIDAEVGIIAAYESNEYGAPRGSHNPLEKMVGRTIERRGYKSDHLFSLGVGLDSTIESDYRITLPKMNINGKTVTIPPILFTRTQRAKFLVPINC